MQRTAPIDNAGSNHQAVHGAAEEPLVVQQHEGGIGTALDLRRRQVGRSPDRLGDLELCLPTLRIAHLRQFNQRLAVRQRIERRDG